MVQTLGRNSTDELFDDTVGYEDESGVKLPAGLSDEERQQAVVLYRLFNGLVGVNIVKGPPGTGKDVFGNYIAHKIKQYFPQKRILRDEKPRRLFGEYAGLFNEQVLAEDLARMNMIASGPKTFVGKNDVMEQAADDWMTNKGQVMLKNSLLYLTEYYRYCYRRDPMNPMNKTMGAIHKMKRHLDVLIIGTVQMAEDLDRKTCLPWVDWRTTCLGASKTNPTRFSYLIEKVRYDKRMENTQKDIFASLSRPFSMSFDAGKPLADLGDGKIVLKRYDYSPETEEERIVFEVLKAGYNRYEKIVELLETEGDMEAWETLATLKELKFRRSKRVIDYPCYFGLYNSKSAPQLKTSIRMTEG